MSPASSLLSCVEDTTRVMTLFILALRGRHFPSLTSPYNTEIPEQAAARMTCHLSDGTNEDHFYGHESPRGTLPYRIPSCATQSHTGTTQSDLIVLN